MWFEVCCLLAPPTWRDIHSWRFGPVDYTAVFSCSPVKCQKVTRRHSTQVTFQLREEQSRGNKRHKMPTKSVLGTGLGQRVLMPSDSLPCLFSRFLDLCTSTLWCVMTVPSSNPSMPFLKQHLLLWPCSHPKMNSRVPGRETHMEPPFVLYIYG